MSELIVDGCLGFTKRILTIFYQLFNERKSEIWLWLKSQHSKSKGLREGRAGESPLSSPDSMKESNTIFYSINCHFSELSVLWWINCLSYFVCKCCTKSLCHPGDRSQIWTFHSCPVAGTLTEGWHWKYTPYSPSLRRQRQRNIL